ncbi:spermidine synthase [Gracilibacillus halophilus YIM-C55.5]|uniref:Polyamine aminopropyltransferase n=1 Tax=Gracilibacillus halophilus YIM-C55.5 TaxID=1308866 RepID=N4WCH5_9BACI|nr:polyamine aminopropyltransferase [Gracilibacillus halophilus]ENH96944.1 spermidine synthase [Gracilibacillus halophilus YIM-C55.5]
MEQEQLKLRQSYFIYWASGIVSICGIVFEVLFGALGSYILGDGVKQYTLTISLFLTGMGIGASLSEKITKHLILSFIYIEFFVAFIGGFSSFLMFAITAYSSSGTDAFFLYAVTLIVGALTGIELPILIRKANEIGVTLQKSTARVLFSDYAGGLIGGLLFVFLLRPQLGIVKTAFFVGLINLTVALVIIWLFRKEIHKKWIHAMMGGFIGLLLLLGLFFGQSLAQSFEQKLYKDPIIHMEESEYQKIVLTKDREDIRLYLDGSLQLSSIDEYRYHEVLVHPTMSAAKEPETALVLGGGDGMAVRELLKYDSLQDITLVDLDPAVVELATSNDHLLNLNQGSLTDEPLTIKHRDAFEFLEDTDAWYDVIIVDLPDPNDESLNKLYTKEFYSLVRNHLKPDGAAMVQATSPVFAREVYWTISNTIASTGLHTNNFHVDVPSFGNWGFVMASRQPIDTNALSVDVPSHFLTTDMISRLTEFGKDEDGTLETNNSSKEWGVNTLIDPILIPIYEDAWDHY